MISLSYFYGYIIAQSLVVVKKKFHSFFNFYIIEVKNIFYMFFLRLSLLFQRIQHFFKIHFLVVFCIFAFFHLCFLNFYLCLYTHTRFLNWGGMDSVIVWLIIYLYINLYIKKIKTFKKTILFYITINKDI